MSAEQRSEVRQLAVLCPVILSAQRLRKAARTGVFLVLAGCLTLLNTGCLTTDVTPSVSAQTAEDGTVTAQAGIAVGASEEGGGFWSEAGKTIVGPFHVYRAKDQKWFPEWREHPYRTTGMTVVYIGTAAALSGGSSKAAKTETVTPRCQTLTC